MTGRRRTATLGMLAAAMLLTAASRVRAELELDPSWKIPSYDDVRGQVDAWVKETGVDQQGQLAAAWHWNPQDRPTREQFDLLDRLVDTFAAASPNAAALRRQCSETYVGPNLPDGAWLDDPQLPAFVRNNLRLYYGRWLAEHRLYDEAIGQLEPLDPEQVVDPASLLFYRMAAYQQLVRPDEARAELVRLLEREEELPRRFRELAKLVDRDLASLDDASLDHIARRMSDIRRRLEYGRTGSKVQKIEDGVVKSLDKKIDDLEKQQQQQQQQQAQAGGSQSSKPMEDSKIAELKAPGRVDKRDIGSKSGWGDLPPKEREQALQQIGREFPAHYRELIEAYFKELAAERSSPPQR